jgi:hypothetical protein
MQFEATGVPPVVHRAMRPACNAEALLGLVPNEGQVGALAAPGARRPISLESGIHSSSAKK